MILDYHSELAKTLCGKHWHEHAQCCNQSCSQDAIILYITTKSEAFPLCGDCFGTVKGEIKVVNSAGISPPYMPGPQPHVVPMGINKDTSQMEEILGAEENLFCYGEGEPCVNYRDPGSGGFAVCDCGKKFRPPWGDVSGKCTDCKLADMGKSREPVGNPGQARIL